MRRLDVSSAHPPLLGSQPHVLKSKSLMINFLLKKLPSFSTNEAHRFSKKKKFATNFCSTKAQLALKNIFPTKNFRYRILFLDHHIIDEQEMPSMKFPLFR
jgi:hypothetical protein